MIDPAELLIHLVRTPSPSGDEAAAAAVLAEWAATQGLAPEVDDAAVRLTVEGSNPGPTLVMASHLDTVPAGDGCGKDLDWWLSDAVLFPKPAAKPPKPKPPLTLADLPSACGELVAIP